jgi:hypothetical protein
MSENAKPVTTGRFDVQGNTISRVIKQDLIYRVLPVGSFGGGPNLKFLVGLWLLHHVGRPLMWLSVRFERKLAAVARVFRRRK